MSEASQELAAANLPQEELDGLGGASEETDYHPLARDPEEDGVWGLIDRGIYMPCSQFEALFVSAAHTEEDIDHTIAMATEVLADLD